MENIIILIGVVFAVIFCLNGIITFVKAVRTLHKQKMEEKEIENNDTEDNT